MRTFFDSKSLFLGLLFFVFDDQLSAQTIGAGSWNILHFRFRASEKWSFFTEGQLRSLGFYYDFHYHEWTGGAIFRPNPNVVLTLAAGDYDTYREGGNFQRPKNNDEFRIWPQVAFSQELGRWRIEHRYRSEQRFTSSGFRFRFRSRVGATVPLNRPKMEVGAVFLTASNELFFTNRAAYFERNRFLIAVGRRFSDLFQAQIGYIRQFDYRINDETGRDFLQVSAQFEWKKAGKK